jgi:hypothetical protein
MQFRSLVCRMRAVGLETVVMSEELRSRRDVKFSLKASCSVILKSTFLAEIPQTSKQYVALNSSYFYYLFSSSRSTYMHPLNVLV